MNFLFTSHPLIEGQSPHQLDMTAAYPLPFFFKTISLRTNFIGKSDIEKTFSKLNRFQSDLAE